MLLKLLTVENTL